MIKEYLKYLKTNGNYSWHDISVASGLPEITIRKIFSGETADPRFETVVRLVSAMGGSLDKINAIEKVEKVEISEDGISWTGISSVRTFHNIVNNPMAQEVYASSEILTRYLRIIPVRVLEASVDGKTESRTYGVSAFGCLQ